MPVSSDFRLYHGNDLELLAGVLADELARPAPGASLLTPDTILIPQPSMRRWLQLTLAERHGIAANLRFLAPGEFVRDALAANLHDDDAALAEAAVLRWRLWEGFAAERATQEPAFAPLRALLDGPERERNAFALASELAGVFEKYQAWRRDWLARWDRGAEPQDWQAEAWRHATRGLRHRGRRLEAYLARFGAEGPDTPQGLPPRLFVFACQNVSPDVLRVIASAARVGPLHLFFVSPVRGWWGDLVTAREQRLSEMAAPDDEHPLLRANGAAGRDALRLVFDYEVVHPRGEIGLYYAPEPADSLLRRLQADLLARRAPPREDATRRAFDPVDRSLQIHACPTRRREVEVLHDQLRALFEADATLQPREVAVLTPDIDAYAPLIDAVFGGGDGREAIPYSIADRSGLALHPVATWFLRVLALPGTRFAFNEVCELLALPATLQALDLAATDLERLRPVLHEAGARWGLDAAQRVHFDAPPDAAYTWEFALDRLLLGYAAGDAAPQAQIVPLPRLEGEGSVALDALITGLRALARYAQMLARPQPAEAFEALLTRLLDELLPAHAGEAEDRRAAQALRQRVARFGAEARAAGVARALPSEVVRDWFAAALRDEAPRQPFLGGGVSFARMVPLRLIPFRVICLLGMNDGDFPRRDPVGALNRLAAQLGTPQRRIGDRSVREDDRYLFLQLLSAAGEVFYLSYLGSDPRSGEPLTPSVVVSELIDVAAQYCLRGDEHVPSPAERLVLRHPLQPFSPQAFGAPWEAREATADAARRRSYSMAWRAAAEPSALAPATRFAAPLENVAAAMLNREMLYRALRNPAQHYLQSSLGLRLPLREDELADAEPFDNDGLRRYRVGQRVFDALRAGQDELAPRLLAEALIAPGAAGRAEIESYRALLDAPALRARRWAPDAPQLRRFELRLGERVLGGTLPEVHARGLLQFDAAQPHGKTRLRRGLDVLIWGALGETRPILRLGPFAEPRELASPTREVALAALQELIVLHELAAREALPFLPKSAWSFVTALRVHADPARAHKAARAQWCGSDEAYAEGRDPWVRLALRGADPYFDDDTDAQQRFAHLAQRVFDALPSEADDAR